MIVIGTIGIVLVTVLVGLLIDRKHSILPKPSEIVAEGQSAKDKAREKAATHAAGAAPATAIRARAGQIAKLRTQRCPACRAAMKAGSDDRVRYDQRELLVLQFTCSCGSKRSLYIEAV